MKPIFLIGAKTPILFICTNERWTMLHGGAAYFANRAAAAVDPLPAISPQGRSDRKSWLPTVMHIDQSFMHITITFHPHDIV
jgi:hypothetical protein